MCYTIFFYSILLIYQSIVVYLEWRVLDCSQLCLLVDLYNAHDVEVYILPMAFHLADDHVAQIRHVTLGLVAFTLVLF